MVNQGEPPGGLLAGLSSQLGLRLSGATVVVILPDLARRQASALPPSAGDLEALFKAWASSRHAATVIEAPPPGDVERFASEWLAGELGLPAGPAYTVDLYRAFQAWCKRSAISEPSGGAGFPGRLARATGGVVARKLQLVDGRRTQRSVLFPAGFASQASARSTAAAARQFTQALKAPRQGAHA